MSEFFCPRRDENPSSRKIFPDADTWRADGSCSYCGSMNPDELMERLEAGTVELGPTDKNYKVYVTNAGGESLKSVGKFYFQHFSTEQCQRFIELLNEKKLKIGEPGHFYRLPFFIRREPKEG